MNEIKSVAVVGAGISGVCAAAHALRQGLNVVLFERSSTAGGVWHFDPNSAHEPQYPNEVPSAGDFQKYTFSEDEAYQTPPLTPTRTLTPAYSTLEGTSLTKLIAHAPPGPCYAGLKNNVSLTAMKTTLGSWPPGLDDFVSQEYLEQYIQTIATDHDVNVVAQYNTRVEDVKKVGKRWRIRTTTLTMDSPLVKCTSYLDAVIVASGHYHMPRIPSFPGLREVKHAFPSRVMHSKGYRNADKFRDLRVLIVGAGVSSIDIAKEIDQVGGKVFQSSRGGQFDLPATSLPHSAVRVAGVAEFIINADSSGEGTLPVSIKLTDGSFLEHLDHIILATGYVTSYPFLPDKHADSRTKEQADKHVIVTSEGDMNHNLYKDIFYIEDPTLAFVGAPYHVSTFSLFDFQAQAVARIFSGKSTLPNRAMMRQEYEAKVIREGLGRGFHSLRHVGAEMKYVQELVDMVNHNALDNDEHMLGHTQEWLEAHRRQRLMLAERFGGKIEDFVPVSLLRPEDMSRTI